MLSIKVAHNEKWEQRSRGFAAHHTSWLQRGATFMLRTCPCLTNTACFFLWRSRPHMHSLRDWNKASLQSLDIRNAGFCSSDHRLLPKLAALPQTFDTFTLAYSSVLQKCGINQLFVDEEDPGGLTEGSVVETLVTDDRFQKNLCIQISDLKGTEMCFCRVLGSWFIPLWQIHFVHQ